MALAAGGYKGYYGFEWEKQWHPDIAEPEVAFPQYAEVVTQVARGSRSGRPVALNAMVARSLLTAIRRELKRRADPVKAPQMRAYMKSAMPYLGVQTPALREACRLVFSAHPLTSFEDWRDTVLALWRDARYREHRYAALLLTGERRYRDYQTLAALPLYEELIVTGAWWDYVDPIASKRIGLLLNAIPQPGCAGPCGVEPLDGHVEAAHGNPVPAVVQGRHGPALLYDCIEPNLGDKEFFIRKAIGWALRQHAWTDPGEVRRYVATEQGPAEPPEHA